MSFLDNLSKTVGSAASTAAKKSGELVEITKINMSINKEEESINRVYAEIGKKFYEINADSIGNDGYNKFFEQIKKHQQTINELKKKLNQIGG
ncbi:hypothetical protein ACJDU8_06250 [Clostridium sp. WILCCON 0269]|uniref:Chemotaxis protein n=1 Tax=Candidatus Clostridium eludens TaxID=3381663 RepID=A0ABW8SHJ4_9CLOT